MEFPKPGEEYKRFTRGHIDALDEARRTNQSVPYAFNDIPLVAFPVSSLSSLQYAYNRIRALEVSIYDAQGAEAVIQARDG